LFFFQHAGSSHLSQADIDKPLRLEVIFWILKKKEKECGTIEEKCSDAVIYKIS
jgi:hypothetical protein